ncbi:macrolide 2'-phosphotransferase [Alkalibacillus haloalkaliphilus]|uniref:Mph(B) family macrolide 2'-phosphotransferase n=1 Tax=Alkalibacillus haloalkaliphilus TaxID=94136 RepID=A0A511W506_9BACI|nr:macrolide 2'-phosphotransferase [Alkalibacillus haloalkaliphilus]GEN46160.1 Mph(B) family macrolide 2'-phosphotransferase [Alkalibacillus haloalkaliphilus]
MKQNKEEIIRIANKYGLRLKEESISFNQSGLDFLVVMAEDHHGDKWILRIPRREDVTSGIQKEKAILEVVKPNVNFQVPNWEVENNELIAYKALTGLPAATVNQEKQQYDWVMDPEHISETFTNSLAKVMTSLHQIPLSKVEEQGLEVKTIEQVRSEMETRMQHAKAEFGVADHLWKRWQTWLHNDSLWPDYTSFTHGDLHAGHTLIGEKENVTGLIDWTEAKVADISNDFAGYLKTHGSQELGKLINAYERSGGRVWPKMKEHVIELTATYPVDIAEFALKSNIDEYKQMAKESLNS